MELGSWLVVTLSTVTKVVRGRTAVNDESAHKVLPRSLSADTGKQINHPFDKVTELLTYQ